VGKWHERYEDERDRRYSELRDADSRAVQAALAASEKAVLKAEDEAKAWRANANEWRAAMTDREKRFVTIGMVVGIVGVAAAMVSIIVGLRG